MKPVCGNHNPGNSAIRCDNSPGNHRLCTGLDEQSGDFVDWSNPDYREPPPKLDKDEVAGKMRDVRSRVQPAKRAGGLAAGVEGSEKAAGTWTEKQKVQVMEAIKRVAREHDEFTTDQVWAELDGSVPVTKGMTAMLMLASRRGILDSTGKTTISERGGNHDHGQRLTIWYSLIRTTA